MARSAHSASSVSVEANAAAENADRQVESHAAGGTSDRHLHSIGCDGATSNTCVCAFLIFEECDPNTVITQSVGVERKDKKKRKKQQKEDTPNQQIPTTNTTTTTATIHPIPDIAEVIVIEAEVSRLIQLVHKLGGPRSASVRTTLNEEVQFATWKFGQSFHQYSAGCGETDDQVLRTAYLELQGMWVFDHLLADCGYRVLRVRTRKALEALGMQERFVGVFRRLRDCREDFERLKGVKEREGRRDGDGGDGAGNGHGLEADETGKKDLDGCQKEEHHDLDENTVSHAHLDGIQPDIHNTRTLTPTPTRIPIPIPDMPLHMISRFSDSDSDSDSSSDFNFPFPFNFPLNEARLRHRVRRTARAVAARFSRVKRVMSHRDASISATATLARAYLARKPRVDTAAELERVAAKERLKLWIEKARVSGVQWV